MGLVQVGDAVEQGGEPGAGRQHLPGDEAVHAFGPGEGQLPEDRQVNRQADQQQGGAVQQAPGRLQVHALF
jgi:hypothetical protein